MPFVQHSDMENVLSAFVRVNSINESDITFTDGMNGAQFILIKFILLLLMFVHRALHMFAVIKTFFLAPCFCVQSKFDTNNNNQL